MGNTSFSPDTTDDEFVSQAAQAAIAASDFRDAAETAAASAEAALASTQAALADYLPLAGGTMTGDIVLAGDPDAALKAATKQYVDAQVASTSDVYDVAVFFPGTMEDGFQTVLLLVAGRGFTLPAGLTGSAAYAMTAPDAETVLPIEKNGSQVGTVTFPAGTNEGTFAFSTETSWANDDTLEIVGPEYADAYLADFSINLQGTAAA